MTWPLKLHLLPNSIWINTNEILCPFSYFYHEIQIQIERGIHHLFRTCQVVIMYADM